MCSHIDPSPGAPLDGSDSAKVPQEVLFQGHVISADLGNIHDGFLEKPFLEHVFERFAAQDTPAFSAEARHEQYIVNDLLSAGRNIASYFGWMNQDTQDLLGETGLALVGTGASIWAKGKEEEKVALRALDKEAEDKAKTNQTRGRVEAALGGAVTVSRSFGLATDVEKMETGSSATTALGQTTFSLGMVVNFFSVFWYGMIGKIAWTSLNEVWDIEKGMEGKSSKDTVAYLKDKLKSSPDDTLEVLKTRYKEENGVSDCNAEKFNKWCKELLKKEAEALAKDFLETINPNPDEGYDLEAAALKMINDHRFDDVNSNVGLAAIEALNLTKAEFIGFESLHRNRLQMLKSNMARSIGDEALAKVLQVTDNSTKEEIEAAVKSVEEGLHQTKVENYALLVFAVFGAAVVVAGTIAVCIHCPPLAFVIACTVASLALGALTTYIDVNALIKTWDSPVGKFENRANAIKLLVGIGCITAICLLSASTLGTFPVGVALALVSVVVITSIFRGVRTYYKKRSEEEINSSMKDLVKKIEHLNTLKRDSTVNQSELLSTKAKIKKIIEKKLQRTNKIIFTRFEGGGLSRDLFKNKLIESIEAAGIVDIKTEIKKWQAAEELVIADLNTAFHALGNLTKAPKSLMESFQEMFSGVPRMQRIFAPEPPEPPEPSENS